MGRRCCIEGCNSRSSQPEHHGVTYHSFPLDMNIRAVWIKNTRLPGDRNITKSVLVCSRHFRRADFQPMKSGKYLLKQRVFPTVFPWGKLDATAVSEEVAAPATATKVDPTAESATSATVEATIAQIMAEAAELNASVSVKSSETMEEDTSSQLGKRTIADLVDSDEPSPKQARGLIDGSPKATAASGTKFEPVAVFNPGVRLEAQDFDGIWHSARVVEVDNDDREVLIKFEKSGKNKSANLGSEEWIPMNSTRLRQKVSTKPVQVFELNDKVMARWTGPRRFPGTIKKILDNDMYEVLFDDGFVKNVRANHMNKVLSHYESSSSPDIAQPSSRAATPGTPLVKQKRTPAVLSTSSPHKGKRAAAGSRKDWPLLEMKKLDLATLNLPNIPVDGEWTCHWVNDQPIGKEGFLIVGEHKKPTVIVDDWRLPPGWIKHMYQRSNVLGKWDVILVTPNGKRFRSKADLKVYLEDRGDVYNPDIYDFSIHRRRAKDINAYVFTTDYTPQQHKPKSTDTSTVGAALSDNQNITGNTSIEEEPTLPTEPATSTLDSISTSTLESTTISKYIEPPEVTPIPPMELMTTPKARHGSTEASIVDDIATTPTTTHSEDGFAYIGALKVQIVDNLFRCPQDGCFKNFRKENHLQIHIKHYHQDFIKLLGACPKMQELAEKRTLGTPDANEPQPKNQIPNQQFFAKLHKQDMEHSRSHRRSIGISTTVKKDVAAVTDSIVDDDTSVAIITESGVGSDAFPDDVKTEKNETRGLSLDSTAALDKTVTDISQTNTTADSSILELSVVSSIAEESATELTEAVLPSKRARFSPSKRTHGSRKSNRQRTTRRYLTAVQAIAGVSQHPVVAADSVNNSFSAGDFEETRHSFNATPDAKPLDVPIAKKRKTPSVAVAPATPLSSLDSPATADSGSSSFLPLTEELLNSTVPLTTPQYIKENGELIKIVQMRQEEIINCLCSYGEEDGLMIQCELCLCWQHGSCNGIEKEADVPAKYVCYICRNPQRGRESLRYKHDQDWLYEGKLPVASYHNTNPELWNRFDLLKQSHTLSGNLVELKRFMHSLRVKINIANNKDHPKMYLWAKKWDEEDVKTELIGEEEEEKPMKMEIESIESDATIQMKSLEEDSDKESQSDSTADTPPHINIEAEDLIPLTPNIPQPEAAIEPVECQYRLLEHIKVQQDCVMDRLSQLESEIDDLEKLDTLPDLKNADLSTTKDVLASFIKELDIMKQMAKVNSLENSKQAMSANTSISLK